MNDISPRFTGIFIPIEIIEIEDLSFFDTLLLSWIDALYCKNHGGCFASNEYLASKMKGSQPNTVAKSLSKLRKMNLIEDVSFNGRKRVLRALIGRHIENVQSNTGLDKNPSRVGQKSNARLDICPTPLYKVYIKDEIKEEKEEEEAAKAAPVPLPAAPLPKAKERAANVATTDDEHDKLISKYGNEKTQAYYQHLSEWKEATPRTRWKKGDYRSILRWVIAAYDETNKRNAKIEDIDVEKINRKGATQVADALKEKAKQRSCSIDVLHDRLEINPIGYSQKAPFSLKFSEKGFKEQLISECRKWGLV